MDLDLSKSRVLTLVQKFQLREMAHAIIVNFHVIRPIVFPEIVNFHILSPIVFPTDFGPGVLRPLAMKGQKWTNLQCPILSGTFTK